MALVAARDGIGPEWLPRLEAAVHNHAREPALAFALGAVLAERQLWGKARQLLTQAAADASLVVAARRRAWVMVAELAEREGDATAAAQAYQRGARLV
jgi:HemY protein